MLQIRRWLYERNKHVEDVVLSWRVPYMYKHALLTTLLTNRQSHQVSTQSISIHYFIERHAAEYISTQSRTEVSKISK